MNNFRLFSSLFCLHWQNYNIVSGQIIPNILQASLHQMFSCVYKTINLKAKQENPHKETTKPSKTIYRYLDLRFNFSILLNDV